jgi:hypothetical protein
MKVGGEKHTTLTMVLTGLFFAVSAFFVYRSFYGMMIGRVAVPARH